LTVLASFFLFAGLASAGEKGLMHCFAFTPIAEATQEQWDAFFKATDALPGKVEGLQKVWYGKLQTPRKLHPNAPPREYGVCMLMESAETLKKYATHPEHDKWVEAYEKVRQPGTTTFDIIGQ
jgi:hypothetical protein